RDAIRVDAKSVTTLDDVHPSGFDDLQLANDRVFGLRHLQPEDAVGHRELGPGPDLVLLELADHETRRIPDHGDLRQVVGKSAQAVLAFAPGDLAYRAHGVDDDETG